MLQDRDISSFNHKRAPRTKALADEKLNSLTGAKKLIYEMLSAGEAPVALFRDGVADYTLGFTRVEAFIETTTLAKDNKVSSNAMGRALGPISVGGKAGARETITGQQRRGVWLLPLQDARSAFAEWLGVPVDWPDVDGGWVSSLQLEGQRRSRI